MEGHKSNFACIFLLSPALANPGVPKSQSPQTRLLPLYLFTPEQSSFSVMLFDFACIFLLSPDELGHQICRSGAFRFMGLGGEEFQFEGGEFEEEGTEEKDKGVPAIMKCFDQVKVYVKAGYGGSGVVAFRRKKYVPFGGLLGDGVGNVYVEVEKSMNSRLPFRRNIHFRAGSGKNGQGSNQHGANGEDLVVKVAPGTVIREARNDGLQGEVLLELLQPEQKALLLRGGRGNVSFKSGNNSVPKIAENGEEGPEM